MGKRGVAQGNAVEKVARILAEWHGVPSRFFNPPIKLKGKGKKTNSVNFSVIAIGNSLNPLSGIYESRRRQSVSSPCWWVRCECRGQRGQRGTRGYSTKGRPNPDPRPAPCFGALPGSAGLPVEARRSSRFSNLHTCARPAVYLRHRASHLRHSLTTLSSQPAPSRPAAGARQGELHARGAPGGG